jgi:hypothetical protein
MPRTFVAELRLADTLGGPARLAPGGELAGAPSGDSRCEATPR